MSKSIKFDWERGEVVTAPLPEQMEQELNRAIEPLVARIGAKWDIPIGLIGMPDWTRAFYEDDTEKKS